VKITLVGRPGRIVEKDNLVLTTMQNTKAPTLPKGLPEPPAEPTTYVVYIAGKQWRKVASSIQDPQDKLILEGYPVFDRRLGAVAASPPMSRRRICRPPNARRRNSEEGLLWPTCADWWRFWAMPTSTRS
jgi:hypothetical protein